MFRKAGVLGRRFQSNGFLYCENAGELNKRINEFLNRENYPVDSGKILQALKSCKEMEATLYEQDKFRKDGGFKKIENCINEILSNGKTNFDNDLLRKIFLLKFPSPTSINIIKKFYERNPKGVIPKNAAMIPLRESLFNGDIDNAVKITDLTTGHDNYIGEKDKIMKKSLFKLATSALGVTIFSKSGVDVLIEWDILSSSWQFLSSVNSMLVTYLLNLSFFIALVKVGRQRAAAGGDYLTWQKGTFYTHWYKHSDEMSMCARIMETDRKMNAGIENSPKLVEELCRPSESMDGQSPKAGYTRDGRKIRLMERKDDLDDIKMQAYWMSGGDGFEWVEPDQDPAELVWKQHLHHLHRPGIGGEAKSLKWAEDLAEL